MWKVIMLGDEEYEEDAVCEVLLQASEYLSLLEVPHCCFASSCFFYCLQVIPEIGNLRQAQEKFKEAEVTGKAMLLVVPKEHAESYVEQLIRSDPMVYAEIEQE